MFSPFTTLNRVAVWADVFREKLEQGVKIRVVTRVPGKQGSISEEMSKQALYSLMEMGVIVDYRHNMHEKLCFIDDHIFWSGSLNPLSHTGKTNEVMIRTDSEVARESMAELVSFARLVSKKDTTFIEGFAEQENPRCGDCDAMTIFHTHGRYGPYFECSDNCGWTLNLDRARKNKSQSRNRTTTATSNPPPTDQEKIIPKCNSKMVIRNGRFGKFWGCTRYPKWKHTEKLN